MKKIGVIHTTPATLQSTAELIRSCIEGAEVMNILDDTILRDMERGNQEEQAKERWIAYAEILERMEAEAVLSACSTAGPFAEAADRLLTVPVLRIDEAMAEEAVRTGEKISVLATFAPTLGPTVDLIRRKGPETKVKTVLIQGAYEALNAGDRKTHDELIRAGAERELADADVIVLAQASMAAALEGCPDMDRSRILTSPVSGIRRLKEVVGG